MRPRQDQIFYFSFLALVGGTACASFFMAAFDPSVVLVVMALLVVAAALFPGAPTVALAFLAGAFFTGYFMTTQALASFAALEPRPAEGVARIVLDPELKQSYRETILRMEEGCPGSCPKKLVLWRAPLESSYPAGTRLAFRCALELPENFSPDFDYRMFLAKDGIGYLCRTGEVEAVLPEDGRGRALRLLFAPKHFFEDRLSQSLPEPEAGLAKGLLLGGDDYMAEDFQAIFRQVGLSHIVAISGYNITLLVECFLLLGLAAGLWRRQALYFALIAIVLFIIMIGMPSSALRAGVMASLVFVARECGRLTRPVAVLVAAGGTLLLVEPLLLRYDIGFQLSFLATLAIAVAGPWESWIFRREFWGIKLVKVMWLTIVVNIFVLPVILYNFHVFSPLGILGNLLVVVVPYAMLLAFLGALLSAAIPFVGFWVALPAYLVLSLITRSVEGLRLLPGAEIPVPDFTLALLLAWYGFILLGMVILEKYRKRHVRLYPL